MPPALLLLFVLVLLIRHSLILSRRKKAFDSHSTNQAVLHMWQYLEHLQKWGAVVPKELEALALKAKFSPHTITQQELTPYQSAVYQLSTATEQGLSRGQHLRFKWISCLDHK